MESPTEITGRRWWLTPAGKSHIQPSTGAWSCVQFGSSTRPKRKARCLSWTNDLGRSLGQPKTWFYVNYQLRQLQSARRIWKTKTHVATRRLLTSQVTSRERPSKYAENDKSSLDRIRSWKLESKRVSCKQHISMPRLWRYKSKWNLLECDLRLRPFKLASLKSIMNTYRVWVSGLNMAGVRTPTVLLMEPVDISFVMAPSWAWSLMSRGKVCFTAL